MLFAFDASHFMVNLVIILVILVEEIMSLEIVKFQQSDLQPQLDYLCLSDALNYSSYLLQLIQIVVVAATSTVNLKLVAVPMAKDVINVKVLSLLLQVDRYPKCPNLSSQTETLFSADLMIIGGQPVQAKLCYCEIDLGDI